MLLTRSSLTVTVLFTGASFTSAFTFDLVVGLYLDPTHVGSRICGAYP